MICVSQRKRRRDFGQQATKFLLAVCQSLSSQIFPVTRQQIECKEAWRVPTAEQQIFKLRSATPVQGADFAINDCSCIRQWLARSARLDYEEKFRAREVHDWRPETPLSDYENKRLAQAKAQRVIEHVVDALLTYGNIDTLEIQINDRTMRLGEGEERREE